MVSYPTTICTIQPQEVICALKKASTALTQLYRVQLTQERQTKSLTRDPEAGLLNDLAFEINVKAPGGLTVQVKSVRSVPDDAGAPAGSLLRLCPRP